MARDLHDLQSIIQRLNDKFVSITFKTESPTFSAKSDDAFTTLHLQMMGDFAEFERNIIRKRQTEGIAKAKSKGLYKERPKVVDETKVKELSQSGTGAKEGRVCGPVPLASSITRTLFRVTNFREANSAGATPPLTHHCTRLNDGQIINLFLHSPPCA
ncbi:recombinase family protein [Roseobacter sp. GAI101]|uniref:recombinase family protein n=1 Tax=Roseobacter sp. (strain GAI101) TaxID=391589 RepID=UPI0020C81021|nr:recombinase family protein [Roseobacter sp. GAI101]